MSIERSSSSREGKEIAVVGVSCRVANLKSPEELWRALVAGEELFTSFESAELEECGNDRDLIRSAHYVPVKPTLSDVDMFDAGLFGINPKDAQLIDPQHRICLECSWEALESAGYDPRSYGGNIGAFMSTNMSSYYRYNLAPNPETFRLGGDFQAIITNDKDYIAPRLAYHLGLTGPCITVQTACSGSLVAVAQACDALLNRACDIALAGGVSVIFPHKAGYLHQEGGLLSPDGRVRPFDAAAEGTVFGDGAGIVVLKRLSDALRDGDHIRAVVRGWAVNNDGNKRVGFTAPGLNGQCTVVMSAQQNADVSADNISYVEAHGTGTPLGDCIEVEALTKAFRVSSSRNGFCALGSIKGNIGHTYSSAGILGLIKTVLALEYRTIPRNVNFQAPNPRISFENSPFYVPTTTREWKSDLHHRQAGVSSFGLGGTNAHVVLQEAPPPEVQPPETRPALLLLSARSRSALERTTERLVTHFRDNSKLSLFDAAYTLQIGRRRFSHRRAVVCESTEEAAQALEEMNPAKVLEYTDFSSSSDVVFMFSGVGDQYVNMGRELYEKEPVFKRSMDECFAVLSSHLGCDLRTLLYPPVAGSDAKPQTRLELIDLLKSKAPHSGVLASPLDEARVAQPLLFAIDYSLAMLWMSWGVQPTAMIGHSIGEYVAACVAGVFSLTDALNVVSSRAELMQRLPQGAMMAILNPPEDLSAILPLGVSIAANNSDSTIVVAGSSDGIQALERVLLVRGIICKRLPVSRAYHSSMVDSIKQEIAELFSNIELSAPSIPYVSNLTGTWITGEQSRDPWFWSKHSRGTVKFAEGVRALFRDNQRVFLEVGPGCSLTSFACQIAGSPKPHVAFPSIPTSYDDTSAQRFMVNSLARLWLHGAKVDWAKRSDSQERSRVPLPTYSFERERYWIEPVKRLENNCSSEAKRRDIGEWFSAPQWYQSDLCFESFESTEEMKITGLSRVCVILADDSGIGVLLAEHLRRKGYRVIVVNIGRAFSNPSVDHYEIRPTASDDYNELLDHAGLSSNEIDLVLHLWTFSTVRENPGAPELIVNNGYLSLMAIAQILGERTTPNTARMLVITNGMNEVIGNDGLWPEKAILTGICSVIPQEYPSLSCRVVDLEAPNQCFENADIIHAFKTIVAEVHSNSAEPFVAHRGSHRWAVKYSQVYLAKPSIPYRRDGVYLITGGLGGLGLSIAEHIARKSASRIVLLGRSGVPDRECWDEWLSSHAQDDAVSLRIQRVQRIQSLGSQVLIVTADVTDEMATQEAIGRAERTFGPICGVLHAAGVAGGGLIQLKTAQTVAEVLNSKVHGTLILDRVFKGRALDFFVLFSSELSIFPTVGQADYAAANSFLDAFARSRRTLNKVSTVSINWSAWKWDAWQKSYFQHSPELRARIEQFRADFGLSDEDGAEALDRVLTSQLSQVAVSVLPLGSAPRLMSNAAESISSQPTAILPRHSRPSLSTPYTPPKSPLEGTLAELWGRALSIENVGIHDNFLELGGNSLIATQIISRLRDALKTNVPLRSFLRSPTIHDLAKVLDSRAEDKTETQNDVPLTQSV
jgi:acyl transferase domain-containing protein